MWEDLFQVVSSSGGMFSWQKWWSQKLSLLSVPIQKSGLMPQAFLNRANEGIEKINVNKTSIDMFPLLLYLLFTLLFLYFLPVFQSGKYYIILVWVFTFIVAPCPFYSLVINCCCCKFICQFFTRHGWVWEDSWLWNLNHLSRWKVASLKKIRGGCMRWCQRRFLLAVALHCWFIHN